MRIINLTQHKATKEQIKEGVIDLPDDIREEIKKLLTFESCPTRDEIRERAAKLAAIANQEGENYGTNVIMIAGAPYLMPELEDALRKQVLIAWYSFSERVSIEEQQPDGTVTKKSVFKHIDFVK